jgi:hypothetical protein
VRQRAEVEAKRFGTDALERRCALPYSALVDPDPVFRLKFLVFVAGVLGVFLVAFVAQRVWYWLKTRKRDDVETSRVVPVIDFSLVIVGALVIWFALEGLALALRLSAFAPVPVKAQKIAEVEVGRRDPVSGQLTLLFYPVDAAGQRRRGYHVPVFTSGERFELNVEVFQWRGMWGWLGERGFYQYTSLGGDSGSVTKRLGNGVRPGGVGGALFLSPSVFWTARPSQQVVEGEVYHVYLSGEQITVLTQ